TCCTPMSPRPAAVRCLPPCTDLSIRAGYSCWAQREGCGYNPRLFRQDPAMSQPALAKEIATRRTFAIISHPDAGKTTITEKLLLLGRLIQKAGSVKGKRSEKHAASDWMTMEQERGISVTSSVMQFPYNGRMVNLLDTPGHEDFS